MKILIFENQRADIDPLFRLLAIKHSNLEYEIYESSQQFKDWVQIKDYSHVLVDLKLSDRTKLEGIELIRKLAESLYPLNKIAVITGHTEYRLNLNEAGFGDVRVMEKPISILELEKFLGLRI